MMRSGMFIVSDADSAVEDVQARAEQFDNAGQQAFYAIVIEELKKLREQAAQAAAKEAP